MIIIYLPNINRSGIIGARVDFFDDVFQHLICRHVVYKIAKNSNVNLRVPDVVALVNSQLQRFLEFQANIIRADDVSDISKSVRNPVWQGSHG